MLRDRFGAFERRACRVLRHPRATQRYMAQVRDDEKPLTQRIIDLASVFGWYGYRRITALLRKLNHNDVLEHLSWLMATRGVPEHIRSDNGSEFTANAVRDWLKRLEVTTLYITPGSPWENGNIESFNSKLAYEPLKPEILYSLQEAKVLIEQWRVEYNKIRPHSNPGYRPPATATFTPEGAASASLRQDQLDQLRNLQVV